MLLPVVLHQETHSVCLSQNTVTSNTINNFPGGSEGKASAFNARDLGSIPGWGRSPGEGNGNPLQYSCLENPMGGEAWWATFHGVTKSQTRLSDFTLASSNIQTILRILCLNGVFKKKKR